MKFFRSIGSSFLLTKYDGATWSFTVVGGTQTWEGVLQSEDIEKSASDVHQPITECTETMKSIFSGQTEEFSLELELENDKPKELSWKKVTAPGVKFSLGTVVLKISETLGIDGVLSEIATLITDLNQNLHTCRQQCDDAKTFSEGLTEKLTLLSDMKTQLESELFTKFVLILNEKKDKIRSLKREIAMLKNELPASEDAADSVTISVDEKYEAKTDVASSKTSHFKDDEVDASFISKLPKRETKKRGSNKKPSPSSSKRSCPRSNSTVSSDDETVDADELVNDL